MTTPALIYVFFFLLIALTYFHLKDRAVSGSTKQLSTAMETPSPLLPQQQQQGETLTNPEAVRSSSAWHSSGSIGPFFAVISVLTLLSILSCVLGRMCRTRGAVTDHPLESIRDRGCLCFGWLKRKCRRCIDVDGAVEGGAKRMMAFGKQRDDIAKVEDGDQVQHPHPQA